MAIGVKVVWEWYDDAWLVKVAYLHVCGACHGVGTKARALCLVCSGLGGVERRQKLQWWDTRERWHLARTTDFFPRDAYEAMWVRFEERRRRHVRECEACAEVWVATRAWVWACRGLTRHGFPREVVYVIRSYR